MVRLSRKSRAIQQTAIPLDRKAASSILIQVEMTMEKVVKVSEEHVWVGVEDQHVYLGLTNYMQGELDGDLRGTTGCRRQQSKRAKCLRNSNRSSTVHEVDRPVSGTVLSVNPDLEDHPSMINEDPYNEGWLVEVRLKNEAEIDSAHGHG